MYALGITLTHLFQEIYVPTQKKLTINEIIIQRNLDFYQRKEKSNKRLRRICEEFDIPIDNFFYK